MMAKIFAHSTLGQPEQVAKVNWHEEIRICGARKCHKPDRHQLQMANLTLLAPADSLQSLSLP
jgi:hypothetical protein